MAVRNLPEMPCTPVLELNGQRKRFHIPFGLKPLVEEMVREVLKAQPENVIDFLASFMDKRVEKKFFEEAKKKQRKSWETHRWSWEASSVLSQEALQEFLRTLNASQLDANHYATIIQAAYRGHRSRESVKEIRRSREIEIHRKTQQDEEGKGESEEEEGSEEGTASSAFDDNDDNDGIVLFESDGEDLSRAGSTEEQDLDTQTFVFTDDQEEETEDEMLSGLEPNIIIDRPEEDPMSEPVTDEEETEVEDAPPAEMEVHKDPTAPLDPVSTKVTTLMEPISVKPSASSGEPSKPTDGEKEEEAPPPDN